ncbi:MAG TPA: ribonuclease HII [Candidatus Limnocylindria bacterium]|nr:ribonuclease HII [Candidatus Limnocylindria bacterium]
MNFRYETKKQSAGYKYIIGCDEVGRGCLAGPVVAAAVVLRPGIKYKVLGIRDSKLLSVEKREELTPIIKKLALAWSVAEVSSNEIDSINIHNASLLAMRRAVEALTFSNSRELEPEGFLAVDGRFEVPGLSVAQEAVIDGDNKILSIAAASIIAKVYRDNLMQELHQRYPIYNLKQHKGYATEYHRKMVIKKGLSPIHRLSFCQNLAI